MNKDSWPRILALKKVQLEQDKLMEEYSRRRYELFLEFQQKAEPLLEKRKGLVTGTAEAEPEEGAGDAGAGAEGEPSGAADAAATEATSGPSPGHAGAVHSPPTICRAGRAAPLLPLAAEATPTKGVPGFWLAALKNHSVAGSFVMEHDIPALKHLVDVRSATLPEGKVRRRAGRWGARRAAALAAGGGSASRVTARRSPSARASSSPSSSWRTSSSPTRC